MGVDFLLEIVPVNKPSVYLLHSGLAAAVELVYCPPLDEA